jgi:glutathione S-transferase
MLTLFHAPDSRSSRFIWLLEELGAEYELVHCDIKRRSGRGAADPRNPHPEKRVPALSHDGVLVTEQAAIALYLTDLLPQPGLGAPIGSPDRAAYLSWLAFYAGEVDPVYNVRAIYGDRLEATSVRDQVRVAQRVSKALQEEPFLLGQQFTAADILVSGPFEWDPELAQGDTRIHEWVRRLAQRPLAEVAAALDAWPEPA